MNSIQIGDECIAIQDVWVDEERALYKGNYVKVEGIDPVPTRPGDQRQLFLSWTTTITEVSLFPYSTP